MHSEEIYHWAPPNRFAVAIHLADVAVRHDCRHLPFSRGPLPTAIGFVGAGRTVFDLGLSHHSTMASSDIDFLATVRERLDALRDRRPGALVGTSTGMAEGVHSGSLRVFTALYHRCAGAIAVPNMGLWSDGGLVASWDARSVYLCVDDDRRFTVNVICNRAHNDTEHFADVSHPSFYEGIDKILVGLDLAHTPIA